MRAKSWLLLAVVLFSSAACSRTTAIRGHFDVMYPADLQFENFNKPIVVGSRLRLFVKQVATDKGLAIDSVEVIPPSRARVVEVSGDQFVIAAKKPGPFRLRIRAASVNGDLLEDSVTMRAEKPHKVEWQQSCVQPGNDAVYPASPHGARIPFFMVSKSNAPMIGYGRQPVVVTPTSAAKIVPTQDQSGLHVVATGPGKAILNSTISDQRLSLEFVSTKSIDSVRLAPGQEGVGTWIGSELGLLFEPTVGGVPMCDARLPIKAEAKNGFCRVSTTDDDGNPNRIGLVRVFGTAFGVCEIDVSFPDGEGATTTVQVPIGKMPGQSANWFETWWISPLLALLAPLFFAPTLLIVRRRRRGN